MIENHSIIGGAYSSIAEFLTSVRPTKVKAIGINDEFGQTGKYKELLKVYKLDEEGIFQQIIDFLK